MTRKMERVESKRKGGEEVEMGNGGIERWGDGEMGEWRVRGNEARRWKWEMGEWRDGAMESKRK